MNKNQINSAPLFWKVFYECPVCGEITSHLSGKCPFCKKELSSEAESQPTRRVQNDEIFLLYTEEYEKYKNIIPKIDTWWWLRSSGDTGNAVIVDYVSYINYRGIGVNSDYGAVRPALRISSRESENLNIGDRLVKYDFPWIKISDSFVIAECLLVSIDLMKNQMIMKIARYDSFC